MSRPFVMQVGCTRKVEIDVIRADPTSGRPQAQHPMSVVGVMAQ